MLSELKEVDIPRELARIERKGYIRTLKSGNTGIGFTLETELGLTPTSRRDVADFQYHGDPVELKSHRARAKSMLTLFTLEPEPERRVINDAELARTFGYPDKKGRRALKVTFKSGALEQHGLRLRNDPEQGALSLISVRYDEPIWSWEYKQFSRKLENLLYVKADSKGQGPDEEFHYNQAVYYRGLKANAFADQIAAGNIVVDLRVHVEHGKQVARNRGTGFRMRNPTELCKCYDRADQILQA